jgi:hypothetical protein
MAAASMKREGKVTETAARQIVTEPSCSVGPSNNLPFDLFAGELLSDEMNMRKQVEGSFGGAGPGSLVAATPLISALRLLHDPRSGRRFIRDAFSANPVVPGLGVWRGSHWAEHPKLRTWVRFPSPAP